MSPKTDDVEYDVYCDPANPRKIVFEDIQAASKRIMGHVVRTPCARSNMSDGLGMDLYLKQEFLQYTGCFKERGLRNTLLLLSDEQKKAGVIAASTGNHGCAVSYHSTSMGIPSTVVMPIFAPITKVSKCQRLGAKSILHGNDMAEAKRYAMALSKEKKLTYINGYDHPNVIEGQGTCGIEIIEQVPDVDAVIVPVGGGSLCAGIAVAVKHLKPSTEVYGIQTDKTPCMVEAFKKMEPVVVKLGTTIADGLGVAKCGVNTFHTLKGVLDGMVMVKEDWVARAIMHIVEEDKYVVEGAGAVGPAAIMAGLFPSFKGKKVVAVISGGNIDTTTLARALQRGMAAEGRLIKFKVVVTDRAGGATDLMHLLAANRVMVRDMVPERAWVYGDVFRIDLHLTCETKGWDHVSEVVDIIKEHCEESYFMEIPSKATAPTTPRGPCLAPNPVCMQK